MAENGWNVLEMLENGWKMLENVVGSGWRDGDVSNDGLRFCSMNFTSETYLVSCDTVWRMMWYI